MLIYTEMYWAYMIALFIAGSIYSLLYIIKHRNKKVLRLNIYFSISAIIITGLNAIILIIIAYPYSSKVFAYNSIVNRELPNIIMYAIVELLILMLIFGIIRKMRAIT